MATEPRSIDQHRPLKVLVIGAGISGIIAGIRLPQRIQNLDLVIYDKNADIGGTWFENRYPGVACDIPAHSYQLTFEPNPNWPEFYASGKDIHAYWKGVVTKYGLERSIRLNNKIVEARFDEAESKWHIKVLRTDTGEIFQDSGDVLYACLGALNEWKWPQIRGLHEFKGDLLHSANWDENWDPTNKTVAVVGSGSSAIQIVPSLQPKVKRLDNYVRGKTWISPPFAPKEVEKHTSEEANFAFSKEEIQRFNDDPKFYQEYRQTIEQELQSFHFITFRGKNSQEAAATFTSTMKDKLAKKPEILSKLLPDFPPACRRLTPGPGYLKALTQDNVDFITDKIVYITPEGVVTEDGTTRAIDSIICATGFDTTWTGRFPIIGRGGKLLTEKWASYPETYLSVATDEFPNMFISLGPNSALGTGSLSIVLERIGDYVTSAILKMQREAIKTMEVKRTAVQTFQDYCKAYFPSTVFTSNCRSWYKGGTTDGRVSALWPGSSLHALRALSSPRWEDFQYEFLSDNGAAWLGDGWTEAERGTCEDRAYYLEPQYVDFPNMHNGTNFSNGQLSQPTGHASFSKGI